jgi:hypothetical protein
MMNEQENKNEALTEVSEVHTEEEELTLAIHEEAEDSEESKESKESKEAETSQEGENADMNDDEAEELASHPMFPRFARGRQGSFHEILVAFREMLHVSCRMDPTETLTAKMTPAATQAVSDVALTERQRAIARAAGMSYREYYHILNG